MADPDWTDPCAVLAWLRPQYYQVIAGGSVTVIRHGDEWTHFGPSDIKALENLMRTLENECAVAQGLRAKRRAITAG